MLDGDSAAASAPAPSGLFLPVLALTAAGIAVILLSGGLGAATSGHGLLPPRFGLLGSEKTSVRGQASNALGKSPDLPKAVMGSGA